MLSAVEGLSIAAPGVFDPYVELFTVLILVGLFLSSLVWLFLVRRGLVLERMRDRDWAQLGDPFEEHFRLIGVSSGSEVHSIERHV